MHLMQWSNNKLDCLCCLPQMQPIIATLKTAMAAPELEQPHDVRKSDHILPFKMDENGWTWMNIDEHKLVYQARTSPTLGGQQSQAWRILSSGFPLPPIISCAREQAMLRAVRMAFLMQRHSQLVKYGQHLEIQVIKPQKRIEQDETKSIKNIVETVSSHAWKKMELPWAYLATVLTNGERYLESHPHHDPSFLMKPPDNS